MSAPVLAVYGGSFNPPHVGHVLAAAYVLTAEPIDRLLVVPCFAHPFGKRLEPFEHRFRMCELAFDGLERVEISTVERDLGGPSLTVRTLEALASRHPGARFRLVVGTDVLDEAHRWVDFERIVSLAPLFVVARSGHPWPPPPYPPGVPDPPPARALELPEVSSTELRALLSDRQPTSGLLPHRVRHHVDAHHLYRGQDRPT